MRKQNVILPDYLDGSITPKNLMMQSTCFLGHMKDYFIVDCNNRILVQWHDQGPLLEDQYNLLFSLIDVDLAARTLVANYKRYCNAPKNYIISKSLTNALLDTDMEYGVKYLPEEFSAYIELEGLKGYYEETILGCFVNIFRNPEGIVFSEASINREPDGAISIGFLNFILDPSRTLKQIISELPDSGLNAGRAYPRFLPAIINAVIFIQNTEYPLCMNAFEGSSKAIETQKKIYTQKGFVYCHKDYIRHVDATMVTGHFRWQPWGEGRTLLKHIYIEPHKRVYKGCIK